MLWRLSFRELLGHPLRSGLVVLGVSVATAMMLCMLMLGAGMGRSFSELLTARGYALRVSPRGTLPLDTGATVQDVEALRARLLSEREVAGVAPILATNLLIPSHSDGTAETLRIFALGVYPEEQGVYELIEGRDPQAGEVVIGRELAASGVRIGDTIRPRRPGTMTAGSQGGQFAVVGIARFLYASSGERSIAMFLRDLHGLTDRPDAASFLMVRLRRGVVAGDAAARLRPLYPEVELASVGELVERAEARLSYFRQLALVLGAVSLLVAVLLVGTLMSVAINERYGGIAALRAIGFRRRSVVRALLGEGFVLCAVSGLLGLGLGLAVASYLDSVLSDFPGLPLAVQFFVLKPRDLATGYVTLLLAGLAATLLPAWRAGSLDIARTLHREEP
jgi:putative ABC transport system permease protein